VLRIQRLDAGEAAHHAFGPFPHHRLEQPLLGSEVAVDGHLRDAGLGGDGVHAGALQPMRMEVAARRFQDAPAALGVGCRGIG
jgi:hypothetical protein